MTNQNERNSIPWDEKTAKAARIALADVGIYPTRNINDDPGQVVFEVTLRSYLPNLINKLDRTDLVAIYRLIHVLAVVPRQDCVFTYIEQSTHFRLRDFIETL